jgi:hypothetical protein
MYKLLSELTAKSFFLTQVPAIAVSIVIAEIYYKFHSFTLECLAFLVTWFVIDWIMSKTGLADRFSRTL